MRFIKKILIFVIILLLTCSVFARKEYRLIATDIKDNSVKSDIIRSVLFPGYTHFRQGKKVKGYVYSILAVSAIVGVVYFENRSDKYYDEYLSLGGRFNSSYDKYRDNKNLMNICVGTAVLVWVNAVIDFLIHNKK